MPLIAAPGPMPGPVPGPDFPVKLDDEDYCRKIVITPEDIKAAELEVMMM